MPEDGVRSIAALNEPLRRRVFEVVRRVRRPVRRDDVASELGISRKLAAFHLDKLLEHGLLRAHYARPPGRSGPGAGRSAKYYEPSELEIEVSVPERRYNLAGELLLEAIRAEEPNETAHSAALRVARERGHALGEAVRRERHLRRLGGERALAVARDVLEQHGFEPYSDDRGVLPLHNCQFHALAKQAPELMCHINQAFIDGLLRGLGNETVAAVLACKPGDCCVSLHAPVR
ncbi:MAG: transcriptional regulator [Actinomycetota bacterium]|nr:transcriptional regulator [Actinomycetota bacterium]